MRPTTIVLKPRIDLKSGETSSTHFDAYFGGRLKAANVTVSEAYGVANQYRCTNLRIALFPEGLRVRTAPDGLNFRSRARKEARA